MESKKKDEDDEDSDSQDEEVEKVRSFLGNVTNRAIKAMDKKGFWLSKKRNPEKSHLE